MNKQAKTKIVIGALATLGLVGGGTYWQQHRFIESTDNAYVHADLTAITSKVEGHVKALKVADNEVVKKGEVLVELDSRDYEVQLSQAKASVAAREAALHALQSKVGVQSAQIAQAKAQKSAADADADRATKDARRFDSLLKQQFTTLQRADSAKADEARASAQVQAAAAHVSAEAEQLVGLSAQIEQAKAELTQAQAQLTQVQNSIDDTVIRAPVDGVIGNRSSQLGRLVNPGLQLMAVMQPESLYVQANFKETQIKGMTAGKPVTLKVDAYPDIVFHGVVDSLSPASGAQFSLLPQDNATGNFTKIVQRIPVKIKLTGPTEYKSLLKPGMSVTADVNLR